MIRLARSTRSSADIGEQFLAFGRGHDVVDQRFDIGTMRARRVEYEYEAASVPNC